MKRLSLLFALSIVLLSFGLSTAYAGIHMIYDVQMEAGADFYHPILMGTYYKANTDLTLDILIGNDGDTKSSANQTPFVFYGLLNGTPAEVPFIRNAVVPDVVTTYKDGGFTEDHSWHLNAIGAEPITANYWATGIMSLLDTVVVRPGWADGTLPDTIAYAGASQSGVPLSGLLPRLRFHFNVPVSGDDIVTICVDSTNYPAEDQYDWQFDEDSEFLGPYCFEFAVVPNLPPATENGDLSESTPHDVAFSIGPLGIVDEENDDISAVGAIDENDNPIGTVTLSGGSGGTGSLSWSFDPPCDWVTDGLSHTVRFYAEDATHTYPNVDLTDPIGLTVTNSAPTIDGDCNATIVAGIEQIKYANFTTSDANVGDTPTWSYTVTPIPAGDVDFTDGVLSFTPTPADEATGPDFVFTVTVTDCAGATATCDVTFHVISELPFFIKIEQTYTNDYECAYLGQHSYVNVVQEQGSEHNLGFDFLIAYDNSALAFMGAYGNPVLFDIPGQYEWEYFTYRFVNNCGGSCPSGLLQVVAIADQNDGIHSPIETVLPTDFVLFTLDFLVTNDYTLECSFVPISFFWRDCTDNSIAMNFRSAGELEVLQAISRNVFGYNGTYFDVTDPTFGFPTFYGAQEECLNDDQLKGNIAFIDFFNGGIKICCSDEIDARGDINLNGVLNEIADAVVFTNYFIHGMDAFTINVEGQKAATDVNNDGIVLSVADLVYLIRVIVGDVLPIEKLNPNMVEANIGFDGQLVTVDAELGAALFVLEGNVEASLAQGAAGMQMKSDVVDGNTRVLIYSFDKGATFSGDILNTEGKMISVEAADYNGAAVAAKILPTSFSVQNFPNPFNPATTISMALPVATNWNLTIYNVAGQKVTEFSGFSEAGINNVVWDASNSASGIYFYKVTTDNGSMTKKMVLLK